MEGATCKCENVIVFSVIFMAKVIASCETLSSLFLFASLSTVWFALKIELYFQRVGSWGSVNTEPATLLWELGSTVPRLGLREVSAQMSTPRVPPGRRALGFSFMG